MRAPDGSLFTVDWAFVEDDNATVLPLVHPYVSGRDDPIFHGDQGYVGEIPEMYAPASDAVVPDRVCGNCYVGDPVFWTAGWPTGTPGVDLAPDGWAVGCSKFPMPVQSVGLSAPLEFVVSGSPVTSTGVLTFRWISEPANTFLAAPNGAAGFPSFRTIQPSDLPAPSGGIGINSVQWYQSGPPAGPGLPTIGTFTLLDGDTIFVDSPIGDVSSGPWVVHTGAWTRPTWYATGQVNNNWFYVNVVNTLINAVNSAYPSLFIGSTYATGGLFTPWTVDTDLVLWRHAGTGGYTFTGDANIMVTPSGAPTNFPVNIAITLNVLAALEAVTFTPIATPANDSIYISNVDNHFYFVNNLGQALPVTVGVAVGVGLVCVTIPVDYTQFNSIGSTTGRVVIATYPAQSMIWGECTIGDIPWNVSGGVMNGGELQYSPDGGSSWTNLGIFSIGMSTNPVNNPSLGVASYVSPLWTTVPLLVAVEISATVNLTNLTQGHGRVFLVIGQFP